MSHLATGSNTSLSTGTAIAVDSYQQIQSLANLAEQCNKRHYLDGVFFIPILTKSTEKSVLAKCVTCNEEVKGALKVSSNFSGHLLRKHREKQSEYKAHRMSKLTKRFKPLEEPEERIMTRRVTCQFSQKNFNKNVANFVLDNMLPFSIVESKSFQDIFDDFRIKCGRNEITHNLTRQMLLEETDNIYTEMVADIREALNNTKYICTTADIWSSTKKSFLGVTAHWIDDETLNRKSIALACRRFPGTHAFNNITDLFEEIHTSFGLSNENLVGTVTDNGSNFVKAFTLHDPSFSQDDDDEYDENNENVNENYRNYDIGENSEDGTDNENDLHESMDDNQCTSEKNAVKYNLIKDFSETTSKLSPHFRCASRSLNLIATSDVNRLIKNDGKLKKLHHKVIGKCQELWKSLKSPKKREQLTKYLNVPLQKPVTTKWKSLYDSLQQILSLKSELSSRDFHKIISMTKQFKKSDFEYIGEYVDIMNPLASAIDKLQGDDCYYGYLLPTLISLRFRWQKMLNDSTIILCRSLTSNLISSLEDRMADYFNIVKVGEFAVIATLTHPKFKSEKWIQCLSTEAQQRVEKLIKNLVNPIKSAQPTSDAKEVDKFFDFGEPTQESFFTQKIVLSTQTSELLQYLSQPVTNDLSTLQDFPKVKDLFLKHNTVIASSAPVERLFSNATLLNLPKFNKLSDFQFEKRVICKINGRQSFCK